MMRDEAAGAAGSSSRGSETSMKPVDRWSISFEELMWDKEGRSQFSEYLRHERSHEFKSRIEFWLVWVGFKDQAKSCPYDAANAWDFADRCFRKYFKKKRAAANDTTHSRAIVLKDQTIKELEQKWLCKRPDRRIELPEILDIFQPAFMEVTKGLQEDAYPNFLQSDHYIQLVNDSYARHEAAAAPAAVGYNQTDDRSQQQKWDMVPDNEKDRGDGHLVNGQDGDRFARSSDVVHESVLDPELIERNTLAANYDFHDADSCSVSTTSFNNSLPSESRFVAAINNNNDPNFTHHLRSASVYAANPAPDHTNKPTNNIVHNNIIPSVSQPVPAFRMHQRPDGKHLSPNNYSDPTSSQRQLDIDPKQVIVSQVLQDIERKWAMRPEQRLDKTQILDLVKDVLMQGTKGLQHDPNYLQSDQYHQLLNDSCIGNAASNQSTSDSITSRQRPLLNDGRTDSRQTMDAIECHAGGNKLIPPASNFHDSDPLFIERNSRAANSVFQEALSNKAKFDNSSSSKSANLSNNNNNLHNRPPSSSMPLTAANLAVNDLDMPTSFDYDLGSASVMMHKGHRQRGMMSILSDSLDLIDNQKAAASHSSSSSCRSMPHQRTPSTNYPTLCSKNKQSIMNNNNNLLMAGPSHQQQAVMPPNPYHVSYNPKLPPSANDSEITSGVSGPSLSDVDYKIKARVPIDMKEMKRAAHKSKANIAANSKAQMANLPLLSKNLPNPIRAVAASSCRDASTSSKYVLVDDESKILATLNPSAFAKKLTDRLLHVEKEIELRKEMNRSQQPLIQEAVANVANRIALLSTGQAAGGSMQETESYEDILEDHLSTLQDWGKTPDRSGGQSPLQGRGVRYAAAAGLQPVPMSGVGYNHNGLIHHPHHGHFNPHNQLSLMHGVGYAGHGVSHHHGHHAAHQAARQFNTRKNKLSHDRTRPK